MGCESELAFSFTTSRRNEVPVGTALIGDEKLDGLEFNTFDVCKIDGRDLIRVTGRCRWDQEQPLLESLVGIDATAFSPVEFEDLSKRVTRGSATVRQVWHRRVIAISEDNCQTEY